MSKETTVGKAPASPAPTSGKDPKPRTRRTEKERLQERLRLAGVEGVEKMTARQLRAELSRIKKEGGEVPELRSENRGVENLNKSPKVMETREQHLFEEVEITITDGSGISRKEKKSTLVALLDKLRSKGLKEGDVPAIREYFDRTIGKPKQEVEYSGDMAPEEQRLPTKAEKAAAKAYLEALEDDDEE